MKTMQMRRGISASFCFAIWMLAGMALANSAGPLDALTAAPGEGNCTQCHSSFTLNSGSGSLTITGIPQNYVPATSYVVTISLADPQASRWGFEFTILDDLGNSVGTLTPDDGNTQVTVGGAFNRTYAKHTSVGTQFGQPNGNSWDVNWTSPAEGTGNVTLYVAGNAANANFSTTGDFIYTNNFAMAEDVASAVPGAGPLASLHPAFPNPFNPRTQLSFTLAQSQSVSLGVYDVQGRLITTVYRGDLPAGTHSYTWRGQDQHGRPQPSGLYFGRLMNSAGQDLHRPIKMTLTK